MGERSGPRSPRQRQGGESEGERQPKGSLTESSRSASADSWNPGRLIGDLPAELQPLAEEVAGRLLSSDGESDAEPAARFPTSATGEPLTVEDVFAILGALRQAILDSGEQGAPRAALTKLHLRLDREGQQLLDRLLRRTLDESRRLLHDVSHDIRSPLNSVLFLADTLLSGHSGELTEVQRRQLGVLYTAAVTLVGLVNDVIDAARLQSGAEIPVSHVSFSIESILSDVENLVAPLATHRGVELRFHLETLGSRSGDRQLLSRVLLNLVTNAAKAAEQGGEVHVRVAEPRVGWLRVEVCDDGPGESLDQLRSLIEADPGQAYPARHGVGWTHGLGLAICARLVHATGGSIEVEGAPVHGTCLRVELPFARV